jgi:hypothetical protein
MVDGLEGERIVRGRERRGDFPIMGSEAGVVRKKYKASREERCTPHPAQPESAGYHN